MMEKLINIHTNYGDLILDPFMGSGTTGEAAIKNGRRFIGIEKQKKFYDVCVERLDKIKGQTELFKEVHD